MTHAWWTQQDWNMDTYSEKPLKSSASTADAGTLFVRKPIWCFQQRLIAGFLQQKHTHCLVQKLKKLFFLSFWVTFARFFFTWRHGWYQALWASGESTLNMPMEWLLDKKLQPFWNIEYWISLMLVVWRKLWRRVCQTWEGRTQTSSGSLYSSSF